MSANPAGQRFWRGIVRNGKRALHNYSDWHGRWFDATGNKPLKNTSERVKNFRRKRISERVPFAEFYQDEISNGD